MKRNGTEPQFGTLMMMVMKCYRVETNACQEKARREERLTFPNLLS
jgi:hypothetical protein